MEISACSWLELTPRFVEDTAALRRALVEELVWEERSIVLFGKPVLQPRLIAWAGSVPYRYSGQTLPPRAPTPTLLKVAERVEAATGGCFNHILVNRYRDGRDSMGFHSDDEPELGQDPLLVALSLGATRRFVIHPKKKRSGIASQTLELADGDLLVMGGAFQHELRHGVPEQAGLVAERLSLTFRRVYLP